MLIYYINLNYIIIKLFLIKKILLLYYIIYFNI